MSPQPSFGEVLFKAFQDCADKPATVLAETLRVRTREWADREPVDAPAVPFSVGLGVQS